MMTVAKLCLRLVALLATLSLAQAEAIPPRTALVIGNADYSYGPLKNPLNDANAVAKSLGEAGFNVTVKTNADQEDMEAAIRSFGKQLKAKGGVGLFYFSGHGAQIKGENYLLPVGDSIKDVEDIKTGAVTATGIVDAMAKAHNDLNIVVLDACRNNPIDPNGAHGLSRIDSNASLFVSYATSPGSVALDGTGNNSPYTKYLAQSIAAPNLSIEDTFKRTLKGVYVETHGEQTPWISSTFFGDFVFRPDGIQPAAPEASESSSQDEAAAPDESESAGQEESEDQSASTEEDNGEEQSAESEDQSPEAVGPTAMLRVPDSNRIISGPPIVLTGVYHVEGTNPDGSHYRGMLTLAQDKDDFTLTWWIGKDVFHGSGHFAGKMLVVNWGDKTPVIYSFGKDGALDGEWADSTATETLVPAAVAAPEESEPAEGLYKVSGKNPDGAAYEGTVDLSKQGKTYVLKWTVGESSYEGKGTLDDNLLTVEWGNATPVVYALSKDGSLGGLWEAGKGEETLTPED